MNNDQIVKSTNEVMFYVERFLNLSFGKTTTMMRLKTLFKDDVEICVLNISTKGHQANINLILEAKIKKYLYNQVFWKLFHSYAVNEKIDAQTRVSSEPKNEHYFGLSLINKDNENKIIFEFYLENLLDSLWINDMFEQWDNNLIAKTKKLKKE